ncbi:hypothetical protein [Nitrosomonas marina]|uniref:Four helix bundle sensory module for signal transduction n=1 Tax=Nitrosomonas marina TaxID=917 RepID=A0A1H8FXG1_9PROT|nr:hypothetical protein [Nitrosomonas marina]SEN35768.1 hypothetical protein SAMN05216325_1153 [Nitrosomonas marina]
MEEVFGGNAIALFGAMFAAIVAGFFAFMNLISSKEQKVSEFRQDWINCLRDSVSNYISSLTYLSTLYKHYTESTNPKKDKFEMARGVEDVYSKVNTSYNDIVFRINENEKNPKGRKINDRFLKALSVTRQHYNKSEFSKARNSCDELREATKPLLKFEWVRVKSGEQNYRIAKIVSIIVLIIGIVIAVLNAHLIWQYNNHQQAQNSAPNKKLNRDEAKNASSLKVH